MSAPRNLLLLPALAVLAASQLGGPATHVAHAAGAGPVLHEQIPADPHEDLALEVALDGDLPVAIDTRSCLVSAPDPRRPVPPGESPYGTDRDDRDSATFTPDRNTKRPDVQGYDEPFTPSTAPFKRLEAFDAVGDHYELAVRDQRLQLIPLTGSPAADGSDEQFFADMVVTVVPRRRTRIPSVGPGARIVRARLGVGPQDLAFHVLRDGADNWFLEGLSSGQSQLTTTTRARLVMELTIPRGTFGGDFANASWSDLPRVPDLPAGAARAAREVDAAIGVSRQMSPREVVSKLVAYYRSFVDSEDPPRGRGDVYLDLALSKKGVCRHRAFAFMVTALSLGIPTRMVINEAHAWVEVHDGQLWRRIDLGGAGHMVNPASNAVPERAVYQPPPDAFGWPQGSERGDDMVENARARARMSSTQPGNGSGSGTGSSTSNGAGTSGSNPSAAATGGSADGTAPGGSSLGAPGVSPSATAGVGQGPGDAKDERPPSVVTVNVTDADAHRGLPLHVGGEVRADGEPCASVLVEVYLRDTKSSRLVLLGTLATSETGQYAGGIVVPGSTPLGDYDVVVRTPGDAKCGRGGGGI